jgi:hypothetical protein
VCDIFRKRKYTLPFSIKVYYRNIPYWIPFHPLNAGPDAKLKPETKQYQGRKRRTHGRHEVKTKTSSGRMCPLPKNNAPVVVFLDN